MNITKEQALELIVNSVSKSEVARKLGKHPNQIGLRLVNKIVETYGLDISHFSHKASISKFQRKYKVVIKDCPVCSKQFETQAGHSREKQTCSHSCSNTFFRSGENNPNWKHEKSEWGYRKICFNKWEKKCVICGFDKVVDVHHLDHNNKNNDINNLVPLCPNHHMMLHTKKYNTEMVTEIKKITGISS
jgi:hypothetical protein